VDVLEIKSVEPEVSMKSILTFVLMIFLSATAWAADKTWTGKISDSMCGASHKSAIEHGGKKMTDRECTLACVKKGGKYVFVSGGKVYNIENQDFASLEEHAGHTVKLTGEMTGTTIKVSGIEMPAKKKG
jgi:predicted methyltransferase